MNLLSEINYVKGVGPKTADIFRKCGIFCIMDLLLYFPRDYEVISSSKKIIECADGEKVIVKCSVVEIQRDVRINGKIITTIKFTDGNVHFQGKWFNQPYIKNKYVKGREYTLSGKVKLFKSQITLLNPSVVSNENSEKSKDIINPIYSLKGEITNNMISKAIKVVMNNVIIEENLPKWIIEKYKLCSLDKAIRDIHSPTSLSGLNESRRRLKFQELFTYSLKVLMLKQYLKSSNEGIAFTIAPELKLLKDKLPFKLTDAQSKVIREILIDEKCSRAMNRLVQGDVGSGKTIVAIISMFNVVKNGYQAAMLAPTEILAVQHYNEVCSILKDFNVNVRLLTGSLTEKQKKIIKEELASGKVDLLIGTHALMEDNVVFKNLGMVVTDEQHRFGVFQRNKLFNKGKNVDILVMTATPIPRTLTLYLYGDLDVSIIDSLPPGRQKIETSYMDNGKRMNAYKFAFDEIKKGRQVYIVCPLVEENEELDISSVNEIYDELKMYFKELSIEVLYGKMPSKTKEDIMRRFKDGDINILVSTTVIEVGVNVPNASVMIVQNAERFGLAQLHQLRGRVGRGGYKSYCILIADIKNNIIKKRMEIMQNSNDGFYIAEQDLKIRGGDEVFGLRQHGEDDLLISSVIDDVNILKAANSDAKKLLSSSDIEDIKIKEEISKRLEHNSKYICFN